MRVFPIGLREANHYVIAKHRHHTHVRGAKFCLGLMEGNSLVGVAIVGRPVGRKVDDGMTLEVNRLCTDGTKNACSMLYGACRRVAREMGCTRIITYILEEEDGTSLKASGWTLDRLGEGGDWKRYGNQAVVDRKNTGPKQRWVANLNPEALRPPVFERPEIIVQEKELPGQMRLWEES